VQKQELKNRTFLSILVSIIISYHSKIVRNACLYTFTRSIEKEMEIKEIKANELDTETFIKEKITEISEIIGEGTAISALSGGVDSATVTMLGHKALGDRLKTYFIDNGIMRQNEPEQVVSIFKELGVNIELIKAQEEFFNALGIDPEDVFGYKIIEPLVQLRKDGVRKVAKSLGLPDTIYNRPPFPGPALATRVIGEASPERVEIVRKATIIVEEELKNIDAFQCMAILHNDKVTGIRNGKRDFGLQIEIRCWDSVDARIAKPTKLPYEVLDNLSERITNEVPNVVSVTYNIAKKPPSTMEAV